MIKISNDPTTNIFMLNIIDNEHINYLNDFCDEVEKRNFTCFSNDTQIYLFFDKWYNEFVKSATIEERENLKRYSGQDFLNTNAVLRNNWNYEVNGLYSEKDARTYRDFSEKLIASPDLKSIAILHNPIPTNSFKNILAKRINNPNLSMVEPAPDSK